MRLSGPLLGLALSFPAGLAGAVDFECPREASAVVTHSSPGDPAWVATPQNATVNGTGIVQIGGQPALVCIYSLFGTDYFIYRRPPADAPNCQPRTASSFRCTAQ